MNLMMTIGIATFFAFALLHGPAQQSRDRQGALRTQEGAVRGQQQDSRLMDVLQRKFAADPIIRQNRIYTDVNDGTIVLSGTVGSLLAKERAQSHARALRGVQQVRNQITVNVPNRAAAELRGDVEQALAEDISGDSTQIRVRIGTNGIVRLSGTVDSWQERHRAAQAAKNVRGVRGVENEIRVQPQPLRADSEIEHDIRSRLKWDVRLDAPLLQVAVEDGHVILSGTVESLFEKELAHSNAWVTGVRTVDDSRVEIVRHAYERKQTEPVTDDVIRSAIRREYLLNRSIVSSNPRLEVRDGTVTLRGTVFTLRARRQAEEIARNTSGVRRVVNRLQIKDPEWLTDAELAEHIRNTFYRDAVLDADRIFVSVHSGRVYLSGSVDSPFDKTRAAELVAGMPGAQAIYNSITVPERGAPPRNFDSDDVSDSTLRENVQDHLFFSTLVDSDDVRVSVQDGTVTLKGSVDSWPEKHWAAEEARHAGATAVRNLLTIEVPE